MKIEIIIGYFLKMQLLAASWINHFAVMESKLNYRQVDKSHRFQIWTKEEAWKWCYRIKNGCY